MKGTSYMSGLAGYILNRRGRWAAGQVKQNRTRRASPFRVESLEARVLLSADLAGAVQQTQVVQAIVQQQAASTYVEGAINVAQAVHDEGYSFIVNQDFGIPGDTNQTPTASTLRIYENGTELGPAHSLHADIRQSGQGQFSHWGTNLLFSASDNSNPLTNGRTYTYGVYTDSAVTTPTPSSTSTTTPVPSPTPSTSPSTATGRVFYVSPGGSDSNSGTQAAPWRTIQAAAQELTAGDTAILLDGVYEEPSIVFANSGTADKPITIRAQNKWGAVLSSISGGDPAFSIAQSYITIEDIRISVSPNNIPGSTYTSASAAIRAWNTNEPTPSNPSTGTQGFTARGLLIDASTQRDLGIKTNQDFSLIDNCVVHNGIEVFNNESTVICNNTAYTDQASYAGIMTKGGARNTQIYNNVVHVDAGALAGLVLGGGPLAAWDSSANVQAYNCVAYDNVVHNDTGNSTAPLFGFMAAKDSMFLNNVGIGGEIFMAYAQGSAPQGLVINPTFKNNTLQGNGGAATSALSGWDGYWTGTLTLEGNNFSNYTSGIPS